MEAYILWGQHRTTELMAIAVKDILKEDKKIQNKFIEYEKWKFTDYCMQCVEAKEQNKKLYELWEEVPKINEEIAQKHGKYGFNLHDELKFYDYDIRFVISPKIKNHEKIKNCLEKASDNTGIKINASIGNEKSYFILAEFGRPKEIPTNYPSKDLEKIIFEFDGKDRANEEKLFGFNPYKMPDAENELFKETAKKYAKFMKEYLILEKEILE